ncbi:MAG: hypothetical protein C0506_02520 [Anaerolinea sp.]|nr:hypothetical protein [Anaerolinea sp.]
MPRYLRNRWGWFALGAAAFVVSVVAGTAIQGDGRAATTPGTVPQSASARADGITMTLEKAVFSASAVDVWLRLVFEAPDRTPAGVVPSDAAFGDARATSVLVSEDGRTVLRFPTLAAPGSTDTEPSTVLTIRAVQVLTADGRLERIPGNWALDVRSPQGEDARAASRMEAFLPAEIELAGRRVVIEAYRTSAATVVRYTLPAGVVELRPPVLKAGAQTLEPLRAERISERAPAEVWFEATQFGLPITVVFTGLQGPSDGTANSRVDIALGPFEPPPSRAPDAPSEQLPLAWRITGPGGPVLKRVEWHRDLLGTTILVTVEGIWSPEPGRKPQVLGDGKALFVRGVGLSPAQSGRGDETNIEADLPGDTVPRMLTIILGGASTTAAPTEVTLRP